MRQRPRSDPGRQLSIFGAETTEPSPFDLVGLLFGPGRMDRMGGTARVSVRVDAAWRVHVLVAELVARGLVVHWRRLDQDQKTQEGVRVGPAPPEFVAPGPSGGEDVNPGQDHSPASEPPEGKRIGTGEPKSVGGPMSAGGPVSAGGPLSDVSGADSGESAASGTGGDDARTDRDDGRTDRGGRPDRGGRTDREEGGTHRDHGGEEGSAGPVAPLLLFEVRTAYSSRLNPLARAWPAVADQIFLSGPRLRLWVAAAGRPVDGGYALGFDPANPVITVDAALRRAGLDGRVSDHGLLYLITGRKRLNRLAELVGERPAAAPEALWPAGAGA